MAEEVFIQKSEPVEQKKAEQKRTNGYRSTLKKGPNTPTVFFFFLNGGRYRTG
jgi:hypothetical protein